MNFNLVEIYNGLLRFNKHILNELAEGLKHLPNTNKATKGDSLIIGEDGNPTWGQCPFIPTIENAAYGIEWTKNDSDVIRIGNAKFHRDLPIQNNLKGCVHQAGRPIYWLNPTGWGKVTENGITPKLDGTDGDVGVALTKGFYIKVIDTGSKYQLWISDYNIDGTWIYIKPFIISHTKTMTRINANNKEEVFSACIKNDDTRYIGGNKNADLGSKLYGRPRTAINYTTAVELCNNRGDGTSIIKYLQYCAIQALCYIEYASFNNQLALDKTLTSEGFKQGGLGAGVTNLDWTRWAVFNNNNPIIYTYWSVEHNIGNGNTISKEFTLDEFNANGTNLNTYPAIYHGILNFFGDIWSFIGDIAIVNRDADFNNVYLFKEGVTHAELTAENIEDKCYFIGVQANVNSYIAEFDLDWGPFFIPRVVGSNKKFDFNTIRGVDNQNVDKSVRVLLVGGSAVYGSSAGSGRYYSDWVRSDSDAGVGFFTTIELK